MAGPCKSCKGGPNGRTGRDGEIIYGPPLNFHQPAPDGIELPVQVVIDGRAQMAEEQPEGCVRGFGKREEIIECPGCPVRACA